MTMRLAKWNAHPDLIISHSLCGAESAILKVSLVSKIYKLVVKLFPMLNTLANKSKGFNLSLIPQFIIFAACK